MARETETGFDTSEDLIIYLKDLNERTSWKRKTDINKLIFSSNDGLMFVETSGKLYELRDCAKESVFERLGMEGEVLNRLPKDVLAHFMSEAAKVRTGYGQMAIVDGKVDAILSDNATGIDYTSIPAFRIFEETQQWIWENTEGLYTFKGAWTHAYVYGKWYTNDDLFSSSSSLPKKLAITLSTSDIGKAAVCFSASLYVPETGYELPLCGEIKIDHRGEAQMPAVFEALNMMQESITNGEDIKKLEDIPIENPRNAYLRVCKKLRLPKKASYEAMKKSDKPIEECRTALDIYAFMGQIPDHYSGKGMNNEGRLLSEIYKAVGVEWQDYDIPGDFSW